MTSLFDEMPKTPPPDAEQFALEMSQKEFTLQRLMHSLGITSLTLEQQVQQQQAAFQQNMEKLL